MRAIVGAGFALAAGILGLSACGDEADDTAGQTGTGASASTGPGGTGSTGTGSTGTGAGGGSTGTGAGGTVDPPPPPPPVCPPPVDLVDTSGASNVVGAGDAASCTEAALDAAIAMGGLIRFDCGPDPVTIPVTTEKVITSDTVIDGGGTVTLDGGGTTRLFSIDAGDDFEATSPTFTVERLTLQHGKATGTPVPLGTDLDGGGGAIYFVGGRAVVIDSVFLDNHGADTGPDVAGGAIYAIGVGGVTIVGSTFAGNSCSNGGAVGSLGGPITIVNSTFVGNEATGFGANYVENGQQMGSGGNAGAVCMDGQGQALFICGSTFQDNVAHAFGGALFRTSYESEPSAIHLSWFDGNQIPDEGPDSPSGAGAIYLQGSVVEMQATTVSNNAARGSAGVWILGHGPAPAEANLTNVTITGNTAWAQDPFTETGLSGGLTIGDNTTGQVLNCTIAGNSAQFATAILNVTPLVVRNTILSNEALNLYTPLSCMGTGYPGAPGSGDHNLQWARVGGADVPTGPQPDIDCTRGIQRADPMLGALGDNGGATPTIVPTAGSPALQNGSGCAPTDQRGNPRGEPCTIGAVEVP